MHSLISGANRFMRIFIAYLYNTMIKFFRKIRQNLLSEGETGAPAEASAKVRKYLQYAIGEILLVMIGILLALHLPAHEATT